MIDVDGIMSRFLVEARNAQDVGSRLSLSGPVGGEYPSVIKARTKGILPDYPYIVVDILLISDVDGQLTDFYSDGITHTYSTAKQLLINYRCYGDDSLSIIDALSNNFKYFTQRDCIREDLGGAIVTVSPVDALPVALSDEYLESASINIRFDITDTFDSVETDFIETINVEDVTP